MKRCHVFSRHIVARLFGAVMALVVAVVGLAVVPAAAQSPTLKPDSCTTSRSGGTATITWVPAANDNASRYLLYRIEDGSRLTWSSSKSASAEKSFTWSESNGADYEYFVKTRGTDGVFTRVTNCPARSDEPTGSIVVRARGVSGNETIALQVNGENVARFGPLGTTFGLYTYEVQETTTIDKLRVRFIDRGVNHDVVVDYVDVDGQRLESEASSVLSRGAWTRSTGCAVGYKKVELIACSGWMDYIAARGITIQPAGPVVVADSFACLDGKDVDRSFAGDSIEGRIELGSLDDNVGIDLRGTTISVHDASRDNAGIDSRWGLVQIKRSKDLCIAGGQIDSPNPYNITWSENYDSRIEYRNGTTRNHVAIDTDASDSPTIGGLHFFNLHDGVRVNGSENWRIEHSWGEYTRDDCVENDEVGSGVIYDSLFDGCYAGYSNEDSNDPGDGRGKTVTFDKVLLRMELMPGPYKTCSGSKLTDYFTADRTQLRDGDSCDNPREIYGTGNMFKLNDDDPNDNPQFNLVDSIFVVDLAPEGDNKADFPPASNIGECSNVTVIYLGDGDYPGRLPPAGCYTLLDRAAGQPVWTAAVADWHARHPDVGAERKNPSSYGDLTFPRPAFNAPELREPEPDW